MGYDYFSLGTHGQGFQKRTHVTRSTSLWIPTCHALVRGWGESTGIYIVRLLLTDELILIRKCPIQIYEEDKHSLSANL